MARVLRRATCNFACRFFLAQLLAPIIFIQLHAVHVVPVDHQNYDVMSSSGDLVAKVCGNVPKHAFCIQALNSDPRTATADLPCLGLVSIDLLSRNASSIRTHIGNLKLVDKCPQRQQFLSVCEAYYADILGLAASCYDHLKKKRYGEMNAAADAAISDAFDCEAMFVSDPCFKDSSPITVLNQNVGSLGDIVASVASFLGNSN